MDVRLRPHPAPSPHGRPVRGRARRAPADRHQRARGRPLPARADGSFAVPGAVAGGLALGTGLGAPFMGRLVDRLGARVLVPLAVANAAGILALLVLGHAGAPAAVLVAVAVATGAVYPPSPSVLRARFPELLREASRRSSRRLRARLGPARDHVRVRAADRGGRDRAARRGRRAGRVGGHGAARRGRVRWLLPPDGPSAVPARTPGCSASCARRASARWCMTMLPVGFAIGALEVAVPAFSHDQSRAELAGVLLATWSLGRRSAGSCTAPARGARPVRSCTMRLTLLLPLGFLPLLVAPVDGGDGAAARARGTVHRADPRDAQRACEPGGAARHQDRGAHLAADGAGGRDRARRGRRRRADRRLRLARGGTGRGAERGRRRARGDRAAATLRERPWPPSCTASADAASDGPRAHDRLPRRGGQRPDPAGLRLRRARSRSWRSRSEERPRRPTTSGAGGPRCCSSGSPWDGRSPACP